MYTVIRFSRVSDITRIVELGNKIAVLINESFEGRPDRGNSARISFSLSAQSDWPQHILECRTKISALADTIDQEIASGIDVCIDTAVEFDDYAGRLSLGLAYDASFLRLLADHSINANITIYNSEYFDRPRKPTTNE